LRAVLFINTVHRMTAYSFAVLVGYFCGSIPFGLVLAKAAGLGDVRDVGSGNIGATNVLRLGNRKIAAATLLCDALKGTLPVLVMNHFGDTQAGMIAGLSAMVGHIFPVWLGFKGGKGVATNVGVLFGWYWPLGLCFIGIWLVLAFLFRFSSLAALVASLLTPFWVFVFNRMEFFWPTVIITIAIWVMHRENISRLTKNRESKIDLKRKA
jgi:acyl phosphate:glycerol-3-phosphate acyltransferase